MASGFLRVSGWRVKDMQIVLWAMASFPFLSSWQAGDDFFAQACQTKTQGRH